MKDRTAFTHVLLQPQGAHRSECSSSVFGARHALRVGIVCMTKQPQHMHTWLTYHHGCCGIERFYLRVEDTPDLAALLKGWHGIVNADYAEGGAYQDIPARQVAHVATAIVKARADGLNYLLHIDDDELLYCAGGLARLHEALLAAPDGTVELHISNIEALAPSMDCAQPFHQLRSTRRLIS